MEKDFVEELGYLALAVRLKRVSESMVHSARCLYKEMGLEIEPNWYLVFKLLKKNNSMSVTEISSALGFSHPTVVNLIKKMKDRDYLESLTDPSDSRRQLLKLSKKAHTELPALEKVWAAGENGIKKMFSPDDPFLEMLTNLENNYKKKNFMNRTLEFV